MTGFDFDDPQWYKDAIIYEVHVKSFFDSNDDGYGDLKGLAEKLDYIQDLGVNCLWVLPFYPSPLKDDGYDIAGYKTINPVYGTMRDFKTLVKEAHARDLKVITELVVNHTSDQHPWFQAARNAPPGSAKRDWYVWSDTDEKYNEVRIIFTDTETSNWTWDPVAKAYYWHRFFSHQPDLNYDNPKVRQAIINIMKYWLDMGVDGLRLDAIPYLIERDGTNCENLPETHEVIKEWRKVCDEYQPTRVFLAEANQWPTDVRAYFGDGDECHLAYNFPVMPRIYMALHQEDRYPVTEIMRQIPEIPDNCQWAIFLRNHDELTLEMVTDEERDYMYKAYAYDPQMKLNVGIRRRLAPLLEHNRRAIELLNNLLFSLPGTPIIYYGDEIGMGDNISLGDRNGVRTPMQWSGDRNGGFSRADFARLYSPPVMDPVTGYQAINVEAQSRNQGSLLNWMRRIIAIRKNHKVFSRGDIQFLHPENRKVLVFTRTFEDETVLVVSNLSRFSQPVALDLSDFKGYTPVEMFGLVEFPPVSEDYYFLTLGPHAFYWFLLQKTPVSIQEQTSVAAYLPDDGHRVFKMEIGSEWDLLFEGKQRQTLEKTILPEFLKKQRWFGGKSKTLKRIRIRDWVSVVTGYLVVAEVQYAEGESENYFVPFCVGTGKKARELRENHPAGVIARISTPAVKEAVLYSGTYDSDFCRLLLVSLIKNKELPTGNGVIRCHHTDAYREKQEPRDEDMAASRMGLEQSNSSVKFDEKYIMKIFRRLEPGINPDLEVGEFLTENNRFTHTPRVMGAIEYLPDESRKAPGESITVALLQELIHHQGDGWSYTVDELRRFYERAATHMHLLDQIAVPDEPLQKLMEKDPPAELQELLGIYLREAATLGRRTAELHLALASDGKNKAFRPEPLTAGDLKSTARNMKNQAAQALQLLRKNAKSAGAGFADDVKQLLAYRQALLKRFDAFAELTGDARKIRCHGDYHLGQVLCKRGDFFILDFEGEPAKPLPERREKQSPLKDVAGMLRSFSYACYGSLYTYTLNKPEDFERFMPWAKLCQSWISVSFLKSYLGVIRENSRNGFLPSDDDTLFAMLACYILDKGCYELLYELNNRPDWVLIPLMSLLAYFENEVNAG